MSTTERFPLLGGAWRHLGDDTTVSLLRPPMEGGRRRFVRRFRRQWLAMTAFGFLVVVTVVSLLAPLIAPFDPEAVDLARALRSPSWANPLGTDDLGRDIMSRMMFAGRVSLLAAFEAVAVAVLLGLPPGLVAGYVGGRFDSLIMRVADALMSFPPLILALTIIGVLGPSLHNAMLAVGLVFAPRVLRMTRASVLSVREETFIEAARSIGLPDRIIVLRHVLPNVLAPIIVQVSLFAGAAMLAEASLSFLGLGVQPPQASWGSMLSRAYRYMGTAPWLAVSPGVVIALCVLSFNLVGDGIRDSYGKNDTGAER